MTTTVTRDSAEARIYATGFQLRDIDTSTIAGTGLLSHLAGRAVPYNTVADVGLFTEEIKPGTFAKSIREAARGLPLLLFHNQHQIPVGHSRDWSELDDGLDGVWKLDDTDAAQEAGRAAHRGMLGYMSVYFLPDAGRSELDNTREKPHITRRSARLVETSLVSTPVYADAAVQWVRSAEANFRKPGAELGEWRDYLEKIKAGPVP